MVLRILLLKIIGLSIFLSLLHPINAQTPQDPLQRSQSYIDRAVGFYENAQYEASIKEYQFAGRIYRKGNYAEKYGICYNGIGNNYINLTQYKDAYMEFTRVLSHFDEMTLVDSSFIPDSLIVADAYEGIGRYYMNAQENLFTNRKGRGATINYDTAMYYHRQALRLRDQILGDKHEQVALSYYYLAKCLGNISQGESKEGSPTRPIQQQFEYLKKALDLQLSTIGEQHYQTANTYEALGNYYYDIKLDYDKGFEYHQKALSIRQKVLIAAHPFTARSYIGLATYYRVINNFDSELKYLEKALETRLKILGEEHSAIAKNYFLLAKKYLKSGDVTNALDYAERAITIFSKLNGDISKETSDAQLVLALCYRALDKPRIELQILKQVLNHRKRIFGQRHFRLGEAYMELGNHYAKHFTNKEKGTDSLFLYYEKAIEIFKDQLGEDHYLMGKAYDNIAWAYKVRGDEANEILYLNKALDNKQKTGQISRSRGRFEMEDADMQFAGEESTTYGFQLYDTYLNLAYFYQRKKDYKVALIYCQNALTSISSSLDEKNIEIYKNPTVGELSNNLVWMEAVCLKADLLLQVYKNQSKDKKDLDFALETYQHSLSLIDTLRIKFTSDGSRQELTRRAIPVYEGTLDAFYRLYEEEQDPKYLTEAFFVIEHSKAFILLQALQDSKAKNYGGVPSSLLVKEERLRAGVAYYSNASNRNKSNEKEFQQKYFQKKRAHDSLMLLIEREYPKYYTLKHKKRLISPKEVQDEILEAQEALVEYFLGDKHLYIFKISKQSVQWYRVEWSNKHKQMVHRLRFNLTNYAGIKTDAQKAYKKFVQASHDFYTNIFEPIGNLEAIDKLIIVPDGILNYIPFETLIQELPQSLTTADYKQLPFLLEDYRINYGYSATLLLENIKNRRLSNNGKCIGFAPSYEEGTQSTHTALPWTSKELKAIESAYSGTYYYDKDAIKSRFQREAPEYGIIHLAMHGIVDFRTPMRSKLAFMNIDTNDVDQQFLYAYEIHNMEINADLVVLSACETGYGKTVRGEGVLSLARAFMYAGTPSVVTTLWQVNDYTSSNLMIRFYQNLDQGLTKPEALRQAKLKYLEKSDHISGHPAFWASFITIGSPKPIVEHYGLWWWVFGGLILGAMGIGYWKRKQRLTKVDSSTIETISDRQGNKNAVETIIEENDTTKSIVLGEDINEECTSAEGVEEETELRNHKEEGHSQVDEEKEDVE
ncbi:MAG: CHAT domain-containing protein [Saprospiraceae bacterium]|nr:CHAT domain-containing protein [Saprospiraceae bacterium]